MSFPKCVVSVIACILIFFNLFAQDELWTRAYYLDEFAGGSDVIVNPNGGYYWVGSIHPEEHSLGWQALLVSINSYGDTLWTRSYGRGEDERFSSISVVNEQLWLIGVLDSSDTHNHFRLPFFMITDFEGEVVYERWHTLADHVGSYVQVRESNDPYIYASANGYMVVRFDEIGNPIWSAFERPDEDYWSLISVSSLPEGGVLASLVSEGSETDTMRTCFAWISETGELEDTVFVSEQLETYCSCVAVLSQDEIVVAGSTRNMYVFYDDYPIMARISRESQEPEWQIVRDFIGFEYSSLDIVNGVLLASITSYHTELGPAPVFVSTVDLEGNETGGISVYPEVNGYNLGSGSTSNGEDGVLIIGNGSQDRSYVWLTEVVYPTDADEFQIAVTHDFLDIYPNPFNSITTLTLSLPGVNDVDVALYDITGRYVKHFAQERMTAGEHSIQVDAAGLPSGIYFVKADAGEYKAVKKVVLVR